LERHVGPSKSETASAIRDEAVAAVPEGGCGTLRRSNLRKERWRERICEIHAAQIALQHLHREDVSEFARRRQIADHPKR
jgi:hypothetical protein